MTALLATAGWLIATALRGFVRCLGVLDIDQPVPYTLVDLEDLPKRCPNYVPAEWATTYGEM